MWKIFFLTHVFLISLNLVTPLVDSATVWRQTMFFTRVLALLGTKPCYLRWFWRSTELISDALQQNMGILSRRFALLFLFFHPSRLFFVFFFLFYVFTSPLVSFSFSCFLFFFKSAPPLVWPKKWIFTYSNVYFLLLFFSAGPEPDFMSSSKGSQILKTVDNSMQKHGKIDVALKKHAKTAQKHTKKWKTCKKHVQKHKRAKTHAKTHAKTQNKAQNLS